MKAQGDLFAPQTLIALFTISALSFAVAIYASLIDDTQTGGRAAAHPYSDSAIGHRAFVEFLRELDVPVVVSRNAIFGAEQADSLLMLMEPQPGNAPIGGLIERFADPRPVLLVLPKWQGASDVENPRFVSSVEFYERESVVRLLSSIDARAALARPPGAPGWADNVLGATPTLSRAQLILSDKIMPIVRADEGILLGEAKLGDRIVYVLSDPDVLNNHGLDEGYNDVFVARMMDHLRAGNGVFIDATLHGFVAQENLWRTAFVPPFAAVTFTGLIAVLLLMWAAAPRFGAPQSLPPLLAPGKRGLIENTASLLTLSGNRALILRDYLNMVSAQVVERLHVPQYLDDKARIDHLDRLGRARGTREAYSQIAADVRREITKIGPDAAMLHHIAARIDGWRADILGDYKGR